MTLESWAYLSEIVGAIAVVASLIYVAIQIRDSNRVNQANARHNLSEFVLQVSMFNAGHADRVAAIEQKISEGNELTGAERTFQWWSHMNMMLHAETYFHHYELGLMPAQVGNGIIHARVDDEAVPAVLLLPAAAGGALFLGLPAGPDQVHGHRAGVVVDQLLLVGPEVGLDPLDVEGVAVGVGQAHQGTVDAGIGAPRSAAAGRAARRGVRRQEKM